MKIDFNDDFRSLLIKSYYGNPTSFVSSSIDSICIKMYTGNPPTQAELEQLIKDNEATLNFNSSEGWVSAGDIEDLLVDPGRGGNYTKLLDINFPNMTQRRQTTKSSVDFYFSQRSESAPGLVDGQTATWFWMYQHLDNPRSWAYWHVAGTVGAIDSGADMELLDPVLVTNRNYKINDISINFNLQAQQPEPVV
jgi:hypothetical protein